MDQLLFYQHNVQQFFLRHLHAYSGVIVPLSVAVSFLDGTNGFLSALFSQDPNKRFFIDPRSALFQYNWERSEKNLRPPIIKMANTLDGPFPSGLKAPVTEGNLNKENLSSSTEACLAFQKMFTKHQPDDARKRSKYAKLAGKSELPTIKNFQFIVPPYFRFSTHDDDWYRANLYCIQVACNSHRADEILPIIHCQSPVSAQEWERIGNDLLKLGIKNVAIYPNDFREHLASAEALSNLSHGTSRLNDAGLHITLLHGGYFAIMQEKIGLNAFGNGIGYGEWRDSGYHRGGTADKRIYIPRLHRFLDPAAAETLIREDVDYFTQDSVMLTWAFEKGIGLATIDAGDILDHFIECRKAELQFVQKASIEGICAELVETSDRLRSFGPPNKAEEPEETTPYESYAASLSRWASVAKTWAK